MTNANDFAFTDTATRLQSTGPDGINADHPTLTKREYFAAIAMQGLLAAYKGNDIGIAARSKYAVQQADSLIKELNK